MPSRPFRRLLSQPVQRALWSVVALCLATALPSLRAQSGRSASEHGDSRIDLFAGYGYLHPVDSGINGYLYQDIYNPNVTASVTGWFSHYIGVQFEGSYFSGGAKHGTVPDPTCGFTTCNQIVYTGEAGPAFRLPLGRAIPFVHFLGGGERSNGPAAQTLAWGWGVTGGGGFDYVLPFFHDHLTVRPFQVDFQYAQVDHGPLVAPAGIRGGLGEMYALKASAGLVARFGEKDDKQPVMLGCTAEPVSVHPGDTVTVTGSTLYLNPKREAKYTWSANGGRITPSGSTATVDTAGLAPGEYTVQGVVSQGSKAHQQASCTAPFTVRPIEPPTVTCTANPASAPSGTPIDISTTGTSPQNRPLTYSYSTSAGQIMGTGATARLTTDGLGSTTVTVTCNVVDDQGQSARSTVTVAIEKPTPPSVPETQSLCTISFARDKRRPVRVDNESKACLDDIALTMGQQSSAKLVIIGDASPDEKPEAAAQRALNERQYLTDEKGIDRTRIEVRVGDTSGRIVKNMLVPAGAIFNDANTQTFEEGTIKRQGQAYGAGHGTGTASAPSHRHRRRPHRRTAASPYAPITSPSEL